MAEIFNLTKVIKDGSITKAKLDISLQEQIDSVNDKCQLYYASITIPVANWEAIDGTPFTAQATINILGGLLNVETAMISISMDAVAQATYGIVLGAVAADGTTATLYAVETPTEELTGKIVEVY